MRMSFLLGGTRCESPGHSHRDWLFDRLLVDSAREWGVSTAKAAVLSAIPFVVGVGGGVVGLLNIEAFRWLTREDGPIEYAQVVLYSGACILSLLIARRLRRLEEREAAFLYLCLAAGLLFLVGEEISWGQRIFGWLTPDTLKDLNKQGESNLHNIYGVQDVFKWIELLAGAYGTFLPWVVYRSDGQTELLRLLSRVVPPLTLVPYFFPIFAWKLYRNTVAVHSTQYQAAMFRYNEIMELIFAMGLFLFSVYQWKKVRGNEE